MKNSLSKIPCHSTFVAKNITKEASLVQTSQRQCSTSMSKSIRDKHARTRIPVLEQGTSRIRPQTAIQLSRGTSRSSTPDDATYAASPPTLLNESVEPATGKESESLSSSLDSTAILDSTSCVSGLKTVRCHSKSSKFSSKSRLSKHQPILNADKITAHLQACREKTNASIQQFFFKQASDTAQLQLKREKHTRTVYLEVLKNLKNMNERLHQQNSFLGKNVDSLLFNHHILKEKVNALCMNGNFRTLLGKSHQTIST